MIKIPWEETENSIRSGHGSGPYETCRTTDFDGKLPKGVKAVYCKRLGRDEWFVQSYIFSKDADWTMDKAKAWFKEHRCERVHERVTAVLPFKILEKIVDKPLKIRGVAITAGMSRNFNIYSPDELHDFTDKLVSAPVYVEHVAVPNAVGKVTKTEWDGANLWYEAEIYDDEVVAKIRKGLIQHVSVGADYETIDVLDGKAPHGLHNAELSLVAVPGIPETNIRIAESLSNEQLGEEFIMVSVRDLHAFLPQSFVLGWHDLASGIQVIKGRLVDKPDVEQDFAFLFLKSKGWTLEQAQTWMKEHAAGPIGVQAGPPPSTAQVVSGMENKKIEEKLGKLEEDISKIKEHLKVPEPKTVAEMFQQIDEKLDDFGKRLHVVEVAVKEAEWDREYINDLPDSAFAYIEPGGEKDEQGKTVPRTLRHLPFKNAQGNIDDEHLRNALGRLPQTDLSAAAKAEAQEKLCSAVNSWNREHPDNPIESEVCGTKKPEGGAAEESFGKGVVVPQGVSESRSELSKLRLRDVMEPLTRSA